jgi:hypothetical protein
VTVGGRICRRNLQDGVKVFARMSRSLPDEAIKAGMKVKIHIVELDWERVNYELTAA